MRRWKIFIISLAFLVINVYALLVGKYQFFPYNQISDLKQYLIKSLQVDYFYFLEKTSPKSQAERLNLAIQDSSRQNQFSSASDVVDEIEVLVQHSNPKELDREINLPEPSAYVLNRSVRAGIPLRVYIHAPNGADVEIFRLGVKKTLIRKLNQVNPIRQSARYSDETGLMWRANLLVPTSGLKSGYYLLEIKDAKTAATHQLPFIVSSDRAPKVAFVAATYTWAAFNNFAGKNFYYDTQAPRPILEKRAALNGVLEAIGRPPLAISLPVARVDQFEPPIMDMEPIVPHYSHLLRAAWNLTAFAEEHNVDYAVYTDEDFDRLAIRRGGGLWNAEIIVFGPHTEYWTKNMVDVMRAYLAKGGKVVFAGGNAAFFEVQADSTKIVRKRHMDSVISTGLAGTSTTDLADPMFAPYKVEKPEHWIFSGTSVKKGGLFGRESLNHREEMKAKGASGWEADQIGIDSKGFELIARGENIRGQADMVFRDTPSGGWVFNASSIPFAGALAIDPVISQIMLNLLSGGPGKVRETR